MKNELQHERSYEDSCPEERRRPELCEEVWKNCSMPLSVLYEDVKFAEKETRVQHESSHAKPCFLPSTKNAISKQQKVEKNGHHLSGFPKIWRDLKYT